MSIDRVLQKLTDPVKSRPELSQSECLGIVLSSLSSPALITLLAECSVCTERSWLQNMDSAPAYVAETQLELLRELLGLPHERSAESAAALSRERKLLTATLEAFVRTEPAKSVETLLKWETQNLQDNGEALFGEFPATSAYQSPRILSVALESLVAHSAENCAARLRQLWGPLGG